MSWKSAVQAAGTPLLWLRHDESGGTVAIDEAGEHNGKIHGTPIFDLPGGLAASPSRAIRFTETGEFISIPGDASLDVGDTFSWVFVIMRNALGNYDEITSKGINGYAVRFNEENRVEFGKYGVAVVAASTVAIADTTSFHLIVVTKAGSTTKIYIDGSDATGMIENQTIVNTAERILVGEENESRCSRNTFDETVHYGTALSKASVEALWAAMNSKAGGEEEAKEKREQEEEEFNTLWPDASWRPFFESAPVNLAVGAEPTLHEDSAAFIAHLMEVSNGHPAEVEIRDDGGNDPVYYVRGDEPKRKIELTDDEGWGKPAEVEGYEFRLPDGAVPEGRRGWDGKGDFDAHITTVDEEIGETISLWRFQHEEVEPGQTVVKAQYGERAELYGDGKSFAGDSTASHHANLLGKIRIEELIAGKINHALSITLPGTETTEKYIGERLWLDMSGAEIEALEIPAWKKTIYKALAEYGAFFVDYGDASLMRFQREAGSQYTVYGIYDPWREWAEAQEGFTHWGGDEEYPAAWLGPFEGDGIDWAADLKLLAP